ncbi:GNAT family N-acetyltransferase [Nocardioides sp. KIGAM211]|uniref:GNAT family N-acetyltransferase n=1 Tax=Nocardioides luti TaxID=2761101 RepID=A0A7X0VCB1_9ACTN|nr:GNAT family N-acetyltransferase [Nocardioides luti]
MGEPRRTSLLVTTALAPRSAAWDALVDHAPVPSPFLRAWWLDVVAGDRAHHLLVEQDGELVGGLPLVRDRLLGVPRFRFAGQGVLCPDHLDLLALPGHEDAVATAVARWFTASGTRVLDLTGLTDDSRLCAALGLMPERVDSAPYQPLPPTGEDYLSTRSSNFRRATRKADRRLVEDGVVHRRATAATLSADVASFRRLSGDREGRGPLLAELPRLERALAAGLERGEARVDVLESPTEVVAVSIAFEAVGRLSLYQTARSLDRRHGSAATVLLARLIDEAVAAGFSEVDMLRGAEAYKASFADEVRGVHRLRAGHGAPARALVSARRGVVRLRPYVEGLLARVRRST